MINIKNIMYFTIENELIEHVNNQLTNANKQMLINFTNY